MCDCGCRNGKLCDLHQFIWETRMKAQRVLDEMPEPTRWERFKLWWTTGGSEFDWTTFVLVLIVLKIVFG
jgi:hypothetical protein